MWCRACACSKLKVAPELDPGSSESPRSGPGSDVWRRTAASSLGPCRRLRGHYLQLQSASCFRHQSAWKWSAPASGRRFKPNEASRQRSQPAPLGQSCRVLGSIVSCDHASRGCVRGTAGRVPAALLRRSPDEPLTHGSNNETQGTASCQHCSREMLSRMTTMSVRTPVSADIESRKARN